MDYWCQVTVQYLLRQFPPDILVDLWMHASLGKISATHNKTVPCKPIIDVGVAIKSDIFADVFCNAWKFGVSAKFHGEYHILPITENPRCVYAIDKLILHQLMEV